MTTLSERDKIIFELRTKWKLEPMDAQDVSLIILADRSKLIDRMANTAENWFTTAPEYRTKANLTESLRRAGRDK